MKPITHAKMSAKRYGGTPEDYLDIHEFMDSSKIAFGDNRHRCITHNNWFIKVVIPKVFGNERSNSAGKRYIPENVAEQHVLEDFGMKFIPTVQDFLSELNMKPWMNGLVKNELLPQSVQRIYKD